MRKSLKTKHVNLQERHLQVGIDRRTPEDEGGLTNYRQGESGPLPWTSRSINRPYPNLPHLLLTAGAYWRGNSDNAMMQRNLRYNGLTRKTWKTIFKCVKKLRNVTTVSLVKGLTSSWFHKEVGQGLYSSLPTVRLSVVVEPFHCRQEVGFRLPASILPPLASVELYRNFWSLWDHYKKTCSQPWTWVTGKEFVLRPMNCPHHKSSNTNNSPLHRGANPTSLESGADAARNLVPCWSSTLCVKCPQRRMPLRYSEQIRRIQRCLQLIIDVYRGFQLDWIPLPSLSYWPPQDTPSTLTTMRCGENT